MATNGTEDLFLKARDDFLKALQPSNRSLFTECASAEDLLRELESTVAKFSHENSRVRKLIFGSIMKLSDSIKPYFDVLNILSQCSEYAAVFWGVLRLIFQVVVTCHFYLFYE